MAIKVNSLMIRDTGGNKMPNYTQKNYEQEMVALNKAFMKFLIGTGAILSIWFISGLWFLSNLYNLTP